MQRLFSKQGRLKILWFALVIYAISRVERYFYSRCSNTIKNRKQLLPIRLSPFPPMLKFEIFHVL